MDPAPTAPAPREGTGDVRSARGRVGSTGTDVIELELPADPAYLGVVRTACAGLGARLDLTLDEIEDLRIAVDEACALVLMPEAMATGSGGKRLVASFQVTRFSLAVRVEGPNTALPEGTSYAWAVLEALAGDVDCGTGQTGSWISLTHARGRAA